MCKYEQTSILIIGIFIFLNICVYRLKYQRFVDFNILLCVDIEYQRTNDLCLYNSGFHCFRRTQTIIITLLLIYNKKQKLDSLNKTAEYVMCRCNIVCDHTKRQLALLNAHRSYVKTMFSPQPQPRYWKYNNEN